MKKRKLSIFVLLLILILSLTLGACSVSTETSSSSFVSTSESETEKPDNTFETDSSTSSIVDNSKTSTEEGSTSSEESKADDSKTDSPTASNTESSTVDSSTTSTDNSKVDSSVSDTSSSSDFNTEVPTPTPVPTSYSITVDTAIANGSITANKETAKEGETVTLTNSANLGYGFTSYTVTKENGTNVEVNGNTFVMPASKVRVTASFTQIDYTITVTEPTGGKISVSNTTVHYGDTITLSNTPATGYSFTSYTVNGKVQTENTFTMPASDITVTGSFTQIDYTITVTQPSNGTITVSKTTAHYGDTITLGNTPGTGYNFTSYTVNGKTQTENTFTMPANDVTVSGTFTIKSFNVTVTQPTGGTIKANESTSFTVNYGTKITLTNSATAGYIFSSYKVNNVSQTANTYTVTSNTTVTGVFNKGIGGLTASSFTGKVNSDSSATGSVTIDGSTVTSTQNKYPFVYSKVQGDFYYEVEVSLTSIYDSDPYPKAGLGIECNGETLFFYIDAMPNGYNNQGFGTNRYVMCRTGTGSFSGTLNWCWDGNSIAGGKWFDTGYVNGSYVKLAVLRVGGLYRFFVDGNYALSVWMPNMDDTALVGLHAFNIGFNAKNAKVGTGNTVTNNARAYYNLNSSKNPTSVTIDGQDQDWGENLVNQYGGSSADGKKYYFASAFKGSDGVYVIYKAKASTFINNANAKENTYIEIHSNISNALLAYANGGTVGISNVHFAAYSYDNSQDILISVEAKIPYSVWNGTDSSTTVTMVFAFGAHDSAQLNTWTNSSDQFWSGWDWTQRKVTTTGYEITRETTPTDKVIKFDSLQFSDPFMLVAGGQYFMYGTVGNNGFRVFVSDDMVSWRFPQNKDFTKWGITSPKTEQYIMDNGKDGGYVYHINWSDKAWGTTNFWAPEIIYNSKTKKYLLYYTAYYPTAGCEKIGVAISDTPLGPFIDVWSGPLLYSGTNDISTKCIDASPFIDDDGNFYLYYSLTVASDGSSETWVIQLDANGYSPIGNPAFCVKCEEEWEHVDKSECACNEGAYMYKHNGKYFLTYSANTFWQPLYAVGLAIGDSPMGPFYKYEGNPIVVKEEGKSAGTGHGMIFKDNNNKLWYLFHTYRDVNKGADGGKCAMAARLWFHNGIPTIEYKNW